MRNVMADLRRLALPTGVFAAALMLYEAAVRAHITPATIAAPSAIVGALARDPSLLWYHMEPTLLTAATGFLAALSIALVVAIAAYRYRRMEPILIMMGSVIDSVPMIALAPVLVIWMGLSLPMRITITTIICLFPILISVLQGLKAAPITAEELFTQLAATPFQRFRLLAIPYGLPYLFVGLKIAAPLSILGALIAEWTGVERGLGVFIVNAMFGLRVTQLWTGVFVVCAISASAYLLVCIFEALTLAGRNAREGTNL